MAVGSPGFGKLTRTHHRIASTRQSSPACPTGRPSETQRPDLPVQSNAIAMTPITDVVALANCPGRRGATNVGLWDGATFLHHPAARTRNCTQLRATHQHPTLLSRFSCAPPSPSTDAVPRPCIDTANSWRHRTNLCGPARTFRPWPELPDDGTNAAPSNVDREHASGWPPPSPL